MTNTVLIKRSGTASSVPTAGQLQPGELAINYADGNLFYKNSSNVVTVIASNQFVSVSGNVTGGNLNAAGLSLSSNVLSAINSTSNITTTGNVTGSYFIGNGSQLTGLTTSAFSTIVISGQSNVVSNSSGVVNFSAGLGTTLTTDPTTGTVTFSVASGGSIFATGGDMGTVTEAVTSSTDLGLIIDPVSISYDLGTLVINGLIWPDQLKLPDYSAGGLPTANPAGCLIFVSDASGGSIPAFSDGSNWRRVDDRTVVS